MQGFSDSRTAEERLSELRGIQWKITQFMATLPGEPDELYRSLMTSRYYLTQAIEVAEVANV